jgi:hypothetical protein
MARLFNLFAGQSLERLGAFGLALRHRHDAPRARPAGAGDGDTHTEGDLWRTLVAMSPRLVMFLMSRFRL